MSYIDEASDISGILKLNTDEIYKKKVLVNKVVSGYERLSFFLTHIFEFKLYLVNSCFLVIYEYISILIHIDREKSLYYRYHIAYNYFASISYA